MRRASVLDRVEAVAVAFRQVHAGRAEHLAAARLVEALLFASSDPVTSEALARRLPAGIDPAAILADLERQYRGRGVNLVPVAGGWAFRTAPDLAAALAPGAPPAPKPSRAALEVLAIVAYHQPVTRAEIEAIRGVATVKGTVDTLLQAGLIRLTGRRRSPGRPVTLGTTPAFLDHFGLDSLRDLPALDELKALGLAAGSDPSSRAGGHDDASDVEPDGLALSPALAAE